MICQRQKEFGLAPDWARGLAGPERWKQRPGVWKGSQGSISTNAATDCWSVRTLNFIASPVTRARLHLDSTIDTDTEQSLPSEPVPSSFHRHPTTIHCLLAVRTTPTPTPTTSKIPFPARSQSLFTIHSPATIHRQPENPVSILTARTSSPLPSPLLLSSPNSPPPPHHPASASASPPPPHRQPNCPQHCVDSVASLSSPPHPGLFPPDLTHRRPSALRLHSAASSCSG